jgi:hypothetical protein
MTQSHEVPLSFVPPVSGGNNSHFTVSNESHYTNSKNELELSPKG